VGVVPEQTDLLVRLGMEIKYKVMDMLDVVHPEEPELQGIYGTIITEIVKGDGKGRLVSKNITIFADAQIDRSPTGTGTAARVALLYKKGILDEGVILENKSVIDTVFQGSFREHAQVGGFSAVIPEVSGTAQIMGFHQFVLEPDDPLPEGFRITGG
jgi:proline racemase